jgi:hypothetical protein
MVLVGPHFYPFYCHWSTKNYSSPVQSYPTLYVSFPRVEMHDSGIASVCHISPAPIHYRNRILCRVFKTLSKYHSTLGKKYSANILSAKNYLSSTSKNTRQRKTLDKLKITKNPKNSKMFKLCEQLSNHYPLSYPLSYHFEWIKFTCYVNGEIRTRNIYLAHILLYHCTTTSIMSILRFYFSCTITNRE